MVHNPLYSNSYLQNPLENEFSIHPKQPLTPKKLSEFNLSRSRSVETQTYDKENEFRKLILELGKDINKIIENYENDKSHLCDDHKIKRLKRLINQISQGEASTFLAFQTLVKDVMTTIAPQNTFFQPQTLPRLIKPLESLLNKYQAFYEKLEKNEPLPILKDSF